MRRMHCLAWSILVWTGCAPAPVAKSTPVQIQARTPDGAPVAGTRLWAAGRALGTTGAEGTLEATLKGSAAITALCPATHETVTRERWLTLPTATEQPIEALELRVVCTPLRQLAALVVRAEGAEPGLPIRVRGEVVGHTDDDGAAHVLLDARPGHTLRVSLDTSSQPELRPQDPVQSFRLGNSDEVLLFDQGFERERPRRRQRRAVSSRPTPSAVPYRIR